jgi:flagellar biosynthesis protein FlhA
VVTLDPAIEDRVRGGVEQNEQGMFIRLAPQSIEQLCSSIAKEVEKLTTANQTPVLLVGAQIRAAVRQITQSHLPKLVVISYNEVTRDTKIESLGMVTD